MNLENSIFPITPLDNPKLCINSTKKLPTWGRVVSKNPKSCQNNIGHCAKERTNTQNFDFEPFFCFHGCLDIRILRNQAS